MLKGFGFAGYRSFGPSTQRLYPLEKINLIVGRNNVGKSNVLRLVQLLHDYLQFQKTFQIPSGLDAHIGDRPAKFSWSLPISFDDKAIDDLIPRLAGNHGTDVSTWKELIRQIISHFPSANETVAWVKIENSAEWKPEPINSQAIASAIERETKSTYIRQSWYSLWNAITRQQSGNFEQHHGPEVIARILHETMPNMHRVQLLNSNRQIGQPGSQYKGLNGDGLISRLLELQSPELASRTTSLEKFDRINKFVEQVLEVRGARLEIPHTATELNLTIGDKVLPINSLGTGVHEVVIFATAATLVDGEILCIEEPEVHLHPRLQRQLIKYLQEQTNNQYFITTHSACLLDMPDAALFHVTLNPHGESEITRLNLPGQRAAAGFDLGYRASDLVQANSIIWVEGPSDRIYINAWIKYVAPDLSEGLHYSIMFYGGRLLSHLTVDDTSVVDFIALQRLNRHVAIVIDSDKRSSDSAINGTKQRILDEIEKTQGYGWVTAGREIENYVEAATMESTLTAVHSNTTFKKPKSQWDATYEAKDSKTFSADKIAIARKAVANVSLDHLDLRTKVEGLVAFIKAANC